MKKLLFGTGVVMLSGFTLLSFKSKPPQFQPQAGNQTTLNGVDINTAKQMILNFSRYYTADVGRKSLSVFYTVDEIRAIAAAFEKDRANPNIKADGIRFYFGSDTPATGQTKLNVKIFLVPTRLQDNGGDTLKSTHGDYYEPAGLFPVETGIAIQNGASQVMHGGGTFYNPPTQAPLGINCANPSNHFLAKNVAYQWIQARCESSNTAIMGGYDTKSEWFSDCFLSDFFKAVTDASFHFSGVRIYLGHGLMDKHGNLRDVLILFPTDQVGTANGEHGGCLEDLLGGKFCKEPLPLYKRNIPHAHPIVPKTDFIGAGYDEGELCPDVCN